MLFAYWPKGLCGVLEIGCWIEELCPLQCCDWDLMSYFWELGSSTPTIQSQHLGTFHKENKCSLKSIKSHISSNTSRLSMLLTINFDSNNRWKGVFLCLEEWTNGGKQVSIGLERCVCRMKFGIFLVIRDKFRRVFY